MRESRASGMKESIIGKKRVRRQVTAPTRRQLTPKLEALKREVATGVVADDSTPQGVVEIENEAFPASA